MQSKFPTLSSFVDFLHHNDLVTIELVANEEKPWPSIPFVRQQVIGEFKEAMKATQATKERVAYEKNVGGYIGERYWEAKAPGVSKVIGTGGVFYSSQGGIRWEAFCTGEDAFICATMRLIPLPQSKQQNV